ncbi:HTH domain-containing protein [Haloarcula laminariae]|uniref:HTH domain-containing protein n=1 Tax=Haloarcula laminariae TaxID=2961577 RepID=UPI0021C8DDA7|nr:HTH domain-containing protein [Halomicroarcula laminariae]
MNGERQLVADRAELYVRSLLPEGYSKQQGATLEAVSDLVEDGVIGERRVQVCGHQIPVSIAATRTAVGERLVTRLAAFREWARHNDCSLAPAMEVREVDGSLTGDSYRALRLPSVLLAEYRDGELSCVTPHHDGDTFCCVEDRLDGLASGEQRAFEPVEHTPPLAPAGALETASGTDDADAGESTPLQRR